MMDATYFTTLSLVVSFLGGGIIGALVNYVRAERSENKERKVKFLDEQIRHLYGPLYYWVSQNIRLFELSERFHDAYRKEFIDEKWSQDPRTQGRLREGAGLTLELANKYIGQVEANNAEIKKIIDANYSYIDPEDIEVFSLFYEHHIRRITEINESGLLVTPDGIYQKIGDISFLRQEFIDKIKEKFLAKKLDMDKLIAGGSAKAWLKNRFK
jgi:hypothetical protein